MILIEKILTNWLVWAHFLAASTNIYSFTLGTILAPFNFFFIFFSAGFLIWTIKNIYVQHKYTEEFGLPTINSCPLMPDIKESKDEKIYI